jgi:predicted NBD/HSP70 family sugar kinase
MLSAGVGAGLILDGALYQGDGGTAGELGHVAVDPGGQICRCGNRGCLETVAGTAALTEALRYTHGSEVTLEDLLQLAAAQDPGALRVIVDAGRAVGKALAGMCSMLDPGMIVIGGELAAAGEVLLDSIRDVISRETSAVTGHPYTVVVGALGANAEALGAAALAMDRASREMLDQARVGQLPLYAVREHGGRHQRTKENR